MEFKKLTSDQLSKLNGQRLKALKQKMNSVVGKLEHRVENGQDEFKDSLNEAKVYHSDIITELDNHDHID